MAASRSWTEAKRFCGSAPSGRPPPRPKARLPPPRRAGRHRARIGHEDHAQPHVEGAEHLVVTDAAALLQQLEERRLLPGSPFDARAQTLGKAAGQVAENPTARDVRGTLPCHGLQLVKVQ